MARSVTFSELFGELQRGNPMLRVEYNRFNGYRNAGLYLQAAHGQEHLIGSHCGPLPERTVFGPDNGILIRGWRDVVAILYNKKVVRLTRGLLRLCGRRMFDYIDRNGPRLPQDMEF